MKAITTRWYGATTTQPARIVARAEGVRSLTHSADDLGAFPYDNAHRAAAEALRIRMGWKGMLVGGVLPDGRTRVWVFCDALDALTAAARATLTWASDGNLRTPGNPYAKAHVQMAERALAAVEGRDVEPWALPRA